jgi:hypothetical protein
VCRFSHAKMFGCAMVKSRIARVSGRCRESRPRRPARAPAPSCRGSCG